MGVNRHNQFYLTLPSNSSMKYYPNNTTANFTTHLPTSINLGNGEWEVALVEAHYPNSFVTIGNDAVIRVETFDVSKVGEPKGDGSPASTLSTIKVKSGLYSDIPHLLGVINARTEDATFTFKQDTRTVEISTSGAVKNIELSITLSLVLGFDPTERDLKKNNRSVRPADIHAALPSHMYVYCDLVEPQFVGDTVAPMLKIVNLGTSSGEYKYGANKLVHFTDPHYVPMMKTSFESVEIDLRDSTGQHLPFHFGATCMKLHLRRSVNS